MNNTPFTQIKNPGDMSLSRLINFKDATTVRNQNVLMLAMRKRYKLFLLVPLLGYYFGNRHEHKNWQFVYSDLSTEDIRYNREFQRMRFLDEPQFSGNNENLMSRQMMKDEGVDLNIHKSRRDLVKKNPHYKYF